MRIRFLGLNDNTRPRIVKNETRIIVSHEKEIHVRVGIEDEVHHNLPNITITGPCNPAVVL
jgi:hypothetical protein